MFCDLFTNLHNNCVSPFRDLSHKNLVRLLGVSLDGSPVYIVTEFCGKVIRVLRELIIRSSEDISQQIFPTVSYHWFYTDTRSLSFISAGT